MDLSGHYLAWLTGATRTAEITPHSRPKVCFSTTHGQLNV
jgi:hypothetical protein